MFKTIKSINKYFLNIKKQTKKLADRRFKIVRQCLGRVCKREKNAILKDIVAYYPSRARGDIKRLFKNRTGQGKRSETTGRIQIHQRKLNKSTYLKKTWIGTNNLDVNPLIFNKEYKSIKFIPKGNKSKLIVLGKEIKNWKVASSRVGDRKHRRYRLYFLLNNNRPLEIDFLNLNKSINFIIYRNSYIFSEKAIKESYRILQYQNLGLL